VYHPGAVDLYRRSLQGVLHDLSAPLNPPFLSVLAARLGRRVNNIDLVAVAPRLPARRR